MTGKLAANEYIYGQIEDFVRRQGITFFSPPDP